MGINAFALILLAFPFYLAQKGRLVDYVNEAKQDASKEQATAKAAPANVGAVTMDPTKLPALTSFSDSSMLFS